MFSRFLPFIFSLSFTGEDNSQPKEPLHKHQQPSSQLHPKSLPQPPSAHPIPSQTVSVKPYPVTHIPGATVIAINQGSTHAIKGPTEGTSIAPRSRPKVTSITINNASSMPILSVPPPPSTRTPTPSGVFTENSHKSMSSSQSFTSGSNLMSSATEDILIGHSDGFRPLLEDSDNSEDDDDEGGDTSEENDDSQSSSDREDEIDIPYKEHIIDDLHFVKRYDYDTNDDDSDKEPNSEVLSQDLQGIKLNQNCSNLNDQDVFDSELFDRKLNPLAGTDLADHRVLSTRLNNPSEHPSLVLSKEPFFPNSSASVVNQAIDSQKKVGSSNNTQHHQTTSKLLIKPTIPPKPCLLESKDLFGAKPFVAHGDRIGVNSSMNFAQDSKNQALTKVLNKSTLQTSSVDRTRPFSGPEKCTIIKPPIPTKPTSRSLSNAVGQATVTALGPIATITTRIGDIKCESPQRSSITTHQISVTSAGNFGGSGASSLGSLNSSTSLCLNNPIHSAANLDNNTSSTPLEPVSFNESKIISSSKPRPPGR